MAKAEQHLLAARILKDARGPSGTACFLCQQAAEAALKALVVAHGAVPPRTHNLAHVFKLLPANARPAVVSPSQLVAWTFYAVAPRYPGFGDARAEADLPSMYEGVEKLVAEARAIVER